MMFLATLALVATAASAADDGQTQPRLSSGSTNYANDYYDIIYATSSAGNVKGIRCNNAVAIDVKIYVNGGSAQTLTISNSAWPNYDTGWIPLNVRFTSSIQIRMERPAWPQTQDSATCVVSWGLD